MKNERYIRKFREATQIKVAFNYPKNKVKFIYINAISKKDFFKQLEILARNEGLDPYDYKDVEIITNHSWFN